MLLLTKNTYLTGYTSLPFIGAFAIMHNMHFSSRRIFLATLIGVVFFGGGLLSGVYISEQNAVPEPFTGIFTSELDKPPTEVNFTPVWRAWNILEKKFVPATTTNPVTEEKKIWGLISGLTDSFGDPYTSFFPPEEAQIFKEDISGSFEGVGMEIAIRDEVIVVVTPLKGSPAIKAGLRAGDKILEIDGKSTRGMPTEAAVKLIRGKGGTPVRFLVGRAETKEPFSVTVVRDVIQIPTIETSEENGIFTIALYNFSANSPQLFREALRAFVESKDTKLILDLRGNPGGYLEAAVDMASWFLPSGKIVVSEDQGKNGEPVMHRSRGYDVFNESLKMAVLVDRGSASASEILAGALQEHGVAKLIGERTFGKGSVQELVPITSDTSLKVTVARWMTPQGRSISEHGLDPDIEVKRTAEDVAAEKDPQMDRAITYLNSN